MSEYSYISIYLYTRVQYTKKSGWPVRPKATLKQPRTKLPEGWGAEHVVAEHCQRPDIEEGGGGTKRIAGTTAGAATWLDEAASGAASWARIPGQYNCPIEPYLISFY